MGGWKKGPVNTTRAQVSHLVAQVEGAEGGFEGRKMKLEGRTKNVRMV